MPVSVEQLKESLQRVEAALREHEREEMLSPVRQRAFRERWRWVLRQMRSFSLAAQRVAGHPGRLFGYKEVEGRSNKVWDSPLIELRNFVIDVKYAIDNLALSSGKPEESELGRRRREVFVRFVFEEESLREISRSLRISRYAARALWENAVERVWEMLADYRDEG